MPRPLLPFLVPHTTLQSILSFLGLFVTAPVLMSNSVVLVDAADRSQGTAEKLRAHAEGWLHRAFSVFVFDAQGRLLLQRRATDKYHTGGLWSNTCCSHPPPGTDPASAARQRLQEEMGFSCAVTPAFTETYRAPVGDGLTEHELDHVFVATVDEVTVQANPNEVADWRWVAPAAIRTDMSVRPSHYTPWFRLLLDDTLTAASASPGPETNGPEPAHS